MPWEFAESITNSDTVIGVMGEADDINNIGAGVRGEARGNDAASQVFGVMGEANGGPSDTLTGVMGRASGGVVNWAGHFPQGNVYVGDTLVVKKHCRYSQYGINGY